MYMNFCEISHKLFLSHPGFNNNRINCTNLKLVANHITK